MDQKEEKEVYIEEIQSCVDYPLDDDIDSDIDLQQPDELLDFIKKRNWKKILKEKLMSKACMIVAGIFCVAILLSLVISFIVSYVLICNSPYPDTIMRFDPHLKNTTEMQIGLDDFDSWIDRDAKMNEWIETMNENSKYLDTSLGFIKEQVRKQYNMDVSNCKSHIEYRVREFSNWKDNDGGVATMFVLSVFGLENTALLLLLVMGMLLLLGVTTNDVSELKDQIVFPPIITLENIKLISDKQTE